MLKLEYNIARKYLKSKRKESFIAFISWFALIGIALGVAVLIIVMSVMNGFRKEIISNIIGTNGHIYVYQKDNKIKDYNQLALDISKIKGVISASAIIEEQALLSSPYASSGSMITGISYEDLKHREIIFDAIKDLDLGSFKQGENVALLGKWVARNLNVKVGDEITIISPNGYTTIFGSIPSFGSVKIIGLIDTGMYQYDSSTVIIPFKMAQSFFGYGNLAQSITIFVDDPQEVDSIQFDIYKNVKNINFIQTWKSSNSYFINALEVERNVMFLILSLVILIAAFNIVSGLIMLVRSKTKEIAILQAMGLTRGSILKIFLLIGIRIGVVGTLIGCFLGVSFALNIDTIKVFLENLLGASLFAEEVYFLSKLPADVKSFQVVLIVLLAMFFTIISSIYPAIRASKIKPAEGLKYD